MWNIKSDSDRLKALENVAQRRCNQIPSRPSSFGGNDSDDKYATMSGLSSSGDEMEDEDGDITFIQRKRMSIRTNSASFGYSSGSGPRARPASADI
mmetsp:Transcript_7327/g.12149  ORF Transcript_7327/g.12149 Transcript_7327/m.12149 type:complete len:96 (+) Transcript_7327:1602-1889(+)